MSRNTAPILNGSWYELLVPIGNGKMATVHVARRRGAGPIDLAAVKRLHPALAADPAARAAMLAEADIGRHLRHPNVVAAREVEDLDAELLLVMDYVEGATLAELLAEAPLLPAPAAVRMLLDAAAGLGALHALCDDEGSWMGAIHRDVAPENLLAGSDGCTRVIDFGSARDGVATELTEHGVVEGRFAYMAPEYLMGYPTDSRADVFSLGVVAWELLAGRRLFDAATQSATMQRVVRLEAPLLSTAAPELGGAFDAVLDCALAKRPSDRYGSVAELSHELAAASMWAGGIASSAQVEALVDALVGDALARRRALVEEETAPASGVYRWL